MDQESEYEELVKVVNGFLHSCRIVSRDHDPARRFKAAIIHNLPRFASRFDYEEVAPIFAERVVDDVVEALGEAFHLSWKMYFLGGYSQSDVAKELGVSTSTVNRKIRKMPERLVSLIWKINADLGTSQQDRPVTATEINLRRVRALRERWGLSNRQAETLLAFYLYPHLRRRNIADLFVISMNTLASHRKQVLKKVSARSWREAAGKAALFLKRMGLE